MFHRISNFYTLSVALGDILRLPPDPLTSINGAPGASTSLDALALMGNKNGKDIGNEDKRK